MRVLIVEDETSVREVFRDLVTALGHEAIPVESAERGLENLQHDQGEAVLLDVRLPGMSGLAFLEHPEVRAAGVPIVVVAGMACEDEARACLRLGALDCLRKPVPRQRLTVVLELIEPYARARRRAAHREERRQAPRAPVSLAVRLVSDRGTGSAGTCTQLSPLGMKGRTPPRPKAGRPVRVGFPPPHPPRPPPAPPPLAPRAP